MRVCLSNWWDFVYHIDESLFIKLMRVCLSHWWEFVYHIDESLFIKLTRVCLSHCGGVCLSN